MRRVAALAALGAVAALTALPLAPASACDPNTFPNCQTYCGWVAWRYRELASMTNVDLPGWPQTGVAGCP
jgi:hypothetical protein